ncbi:MAG TPA: hypothetical protein DDY13_11845 [Cytophagales bacterium]|nr:hypothetical protein [Cytophagales bacterium]
MKKYSLILSERISPDTRIKVYELCKNGESLLQEFIDKIERDEILFDKVARALSIVEHSSNGLLLPKTKFRQLHDEKLPCKLYEAKAGIIRLYLFHEEKTGRVIVTGGKKDSQEKDIKAVTKIIKDYYNEHK